MKEISAKSSRDLFALGVSRRSDSSNTAEMTERAGRRKRSGVGSIWSGSKHWVCTGLLLPFPASFAARCSSPIGSSTVCSIEKSGLKEPKDAVKNVTDTMGDHMTDVAQDIFESVDAALLGVSIVAVLVVILLLMIVVLRYMAHQKGTYYTHEEALTLKSESDVQIVQEVQDIQEDSEDES